MFIAYAVPKNDYHLVVEDGLGYMEAGPTREEALQNLLRKFAKDHEEDNARAVKAGYQPEPALNPEEDYAIHVTEV